MRYVVAALLAGTFAAPASAGETVLYERPPAWIDAAAIEPKQAGSNAILLLLDQQARIETGRLWSYMDTAIALDSPEALTRFGTISASWMPDKGDLIVHRVELIRGGEVIDVIKAGAVFEVLRREKGLEKRLVDGSLTATLAVPGAKLGDVLRLTYSVTTSDQAMGDNVQWQSGLIAKPVPLQKGRVQVSWPEGMAVSRLRLGKAQVPEPVATGGFMVWTADMPVAEEDPMPEDAPARFKLGELMQVSTYADWAAVSRNHAKHYRTAGAIKPGSDLAGRLAAIAAASSDPRTRAAAALRLVQDDVSYLMKGMDGGNYIPQAPEDTWDKRFGDCKAKSLLLLAMLRELGIKAEPVLVRIQGGDMLPQLAPLPGNFNHVIVRAEIGGTNYWLDGTTSGVRIDTIDEVPRFFHGLPLREEGAGLMPFDTRVQATPDREVSLTVDHRAGVQVPAAYDLTITYRSSMGARWRATADQANNKLTRDAVVEAVENVIGDNQLVEHSLTYDADTGVAVLKARGIIDSGWERDGTDYRFETPAQAARSISFDADRARAAWRAIPLALRGPLYLTSTAEVLLPEGMTAALEGAKEPVSSTIGGVELVSKAELSDRRLTLGQSMRTRDEELAADRIAAARRELTRFDRQLPVLRSAGGVRERWDYLGKDRARLSALETLFARAIAEAEPDDPVPLIHRANFYLDIFDQAAALKDVEAAMAIEDSHSLVMARARLRREFGDLDGALADLVEAEALEPDGSTYGAQIEILALTGRADEGLGLADDYEALTKERPAQAMMRAHALGWAGQADEGIALLEDMIAERPTDGDLLNALCWEAGVWSRMNETRLATCTQAVEKSENSPDALDSRAMAHFRMGNLAAALADVEAALLAEPYLTPSRLMRGVIRMKMGDKAGREDITLALKMRPAMAATYKAWGIAL
jgi:tetratricopeptide (TPR) repeat protein